MREFFYDILLFTVFAIENGFSDGLLMSIEDNSTPLASYLSLALFFTSTADMDTTFSLLLCFYSSELFCCITTSWFDYALSADKDGRSDSFILILWRIEDAGMILLNIYNLILSDSTLIQNNLLANN